MAKGYNNIRTTEIKVQETINSFKSIYNIARGGINYTSTPNPIKKIKCTLHTLIKSSFKVTGDTRV